MILSRFIKRAEGAISIFLCIVLSIMIILTGVLVDGSRIRSGETQTQSAVENVARSQLADYDTKLKELYGLFALAENNPDALKENTESLLNTNLMTELGADKKSMSDKTFDYFYNSVFGDDKFKNVNFMNLYDYRVEDLKVTPMFNLAEDEVLRSQIVEYMKYRAPKELAELFIDKLMAFKDFGKQSKILSKKIKVDKKLDKIKENQENLSDEVDVINNFGTGAGKTDLLNSQMEAYVAAVADRVQAEKDLKKAEDEKKAAEDELTKISAEKKSINDRISELSKDEDTDSETGIDAGIKAGTKTGTSGKISALNEQLKALNKQEKVQNERKTKAIADMEKYTAQKNKFNTDADNARGWLVSEVGTCLESVDNAKDNVDEIKTKSKETVEIIDDINNNDLKNDSSDFANSVRVDTGGKKVKIEDKVMDTVGGQLSTNKTVLKKLKSILDSVEHKRDIKFDKIADSDIKGQVKSIVRSDEFLNELKNYNGNINDSKDIKYRVIKPVGDESQPDPAEGAEGAAADFEKMSKEKAEDPKNQTIPDDVLKELPSSVGDSIPKEISDIISQDSLDVKKLLKEVDMSEEKTKTLLEGNEPVPMNDPLKNAKFKDDNDDEKNGFSEDALGFIGSIGDMLAKGLENMRDELYVDEYAMSTFRNELTDKFVKDPVAEKDKLEMDLRYNPKYERKEKTFFNKGEIEYIINGDANETNNLLAVKARLILVRFALNTLYIYTDRVKFQMALTIAEAVAGWSIIGVPIVHTLIMLGWSLAESILDVYYLTEQEGVEVPIFKTKDTWVLSELGMLNKLKETVAQKVNETAKEAVDYGVDYATDKVETLINSANGKIDDMVQSKVEVAVDKVFKPIESITTDVVDGATDIFNNYTDSMNGKFDELVDSNMGKLDAQIDSRTNELFNQVEGQLKIELDSLQSDINTLKGQLSNEIKAKSKDEVEKIKKEYQTKINAVNSKIKGKIDKAKGDLITKIKSSISGIVDDIKNTLDSKVNDVAKTGKEKLNAYIDSLSGKTKSGSIKNNFKTSFLTLSYQGYLRLFLLFTSPSKKINRIADLIQLNMKKENGYEDFKLSDYNTYLRIEANVSMKYLFMSQPFISKKYRTFDGKRHLFNIKLYQGY